MQRAVETTVLLVVAPLVIVSLFDILIGLGVYIGHRKVIHAIFPSYYIDFVILGVFGIALYISIKMASPQKSAVQMYIDRVMRPPHPDSGSHDTWKSIREDPNDLRIWTKVLANQYHAEQYVLSHRSEFTDEHKIVFSDGRVIKKQLTWDGLPNDVPEGAFIGDVWDFLHPNEEPNVNVDQISAAFNGLAAEVRVSVGKGNHIINNKMKIDTGADMTMILIAQRHFITCIPGKNQRIGHATGSALLPTVYVDIALDEKIVPNVRVLLGKKQLLGMDVIGHFLHNWNQTISCTIDRP